MPELARRVQVRDIVRRSVRLGLRSKGHDYDGFDARQNKRSVKPRPLPNPRQGVTM